MDELIIILIRALAALFEKNKAPTRVPSRNPGAKPLAPNAPPAFVAGLPPQRRVVLPKGGARRRNAPPLPVPPPLVSPDDVVIARQSDIDKARVAAAPHVATGGVSADARSIRSWLSPTVLQRQFILTEIFQKPLAMREFDER